MIETDTLEVKVAEIDQRCRNNTDRIDEMQGKLEDYGEMASAIKVLANEQGHIKDDVSEIKRNVKGITEKPGKRWEDLTNSIISIIVGALLALAFTHMGIG